MPKAWTQELGRAHLHDAQTRPEAPRRRPGALYAAVARDESAVAWHSRGGPLGPRASHAAHSCEECKPQDCFAPVSTSKVCDGCCTGSPEPLCTARNTSEGDRICRTLDQAGDLSTTKQPAGASSAWQAQPLRGWPGRFCLSVCLCPARSSVLARLSSVWKPNHPALLTPSHGTRALRSGQRNRNGGQTPCSLLAAGYADGSLSLARL
jgi:hypothetical protein